MNRVFSRDSYINSCYYGFSILEERLNEWIYEIMNIIKQIFDVIQWMNEWAFFSSYYLSDHKELKDKLIRNWFPFLSRYSSFFLPFLIQSPLLQYNGWFLSLSLALLLLLLFEASSSWCSQQSHISKKSQVFDWPFTSLVYIIYFFLKKT